MNLEIHPLKNWILLRFPDRIDALNIRDFVTAVETQLETKKRIAFDMRRVQFINFQALKYLHQVGMEINQVGGQAAMVGPSEKLKRQFALFASLDPFRLFSSSEWEQQPKAERFQETVASP